MKLLQDSFRARHKASNRAGLVIGVTLEARGQKGRAPSRYIWLETGARCFADLGTEVGEKMPEYFEAEELESNDE